VVDALAGMDWGLFAIALVVGLVASIFGGIAGYGTGLILPIFLAPIVGITGVMPTLSLVMIMANLSRIAAFRRELQPRQALMVMVGAVPAAAIGASIYAMLSERAIAVVLAITLIVTIPLRRALERLKFRLTDPGLVVGGGAFGLFAGATVGTGPILVAILLAAGVAPASIVATDALVSIFVGLMRIGTFALNDLYTPLLVLTGIAVGLSAVPGGFVARWIVARIPVKVHATVIESVIVVGAILLLYKSIVG